MRPSSILLALTLAMLSTGQPSAWAASPIKPTPSTPTPIPLDPLPPLGRGCTRVFSDEMTGQSDRPAAHAKVGACAEATPDEGKRQASQSSLDCLMNGYENSTDLSITCTMIRQRAAKVATYQLHFESRWRCYKATCPPAK